MRRSLMSRARKQKLTARSRRQVSRIPSGISLWIGAGQNACTRPLTGACSSHLCQAHKTRGFPSCNFVSFVVAILLAKDRKAEAWADGEIQSCHLLQRRMELRITARLQRNDKGQRRLVVSRFLQ